jgi:DNA-binding CsgD family transcriptional regulator
MKSEFYLEAKKLWRTVSNNHAAEINDLQVQIEINKKLLNIFQAGNYYYFIFNVFEANFEHISQELFSVLGYEAQEMNVGFFLSKIHPQDQSYFLNFEKTVVEFYDSIEHHKIPNYKIQYDFRIKKADNSYIRILHQLVILQHNKNVLQRSFGLHTDITHIKPEGIPLLSIIGLDDEPSFYNIQPETFFAKSVAIFTAREKEILRYIVEGKTSLEIANLLFISIHTVNTHRKSILEKSNTKSATELVYKTINEGWI